MGDSLFFFFFSAADPVALSPSLTVEFDEEDVKDSRREGRPCTSIRVPSGSLLVLPARLRVTGGRLLIGLFCRSLGVILDGATTLGDCEDIEVGVVSLL